MLESICGSIAHVLQVGDHQTCVGGVKPVFWLTELWKELGGSLRSEPFNQALLVSYGPRGFAEACPYNKCLAEERLVVSHGRLHKRVWTPLSGLTAVIDVTSGFALN